MNTIDKRKIEENALNLFNSGYNCAQSVLIAFSELLKIDKKTAGNIASGFGAGMGRLQNTCGAVTGAYMVIGLYANNENNDNIEDTYQKIQQFDKNFTQKNGTTICQALINCDLKTTEGKTRFKEKNLKKAVCENCIKDSISFLLLQTNKTD